MFVNGQIPEMSRERYDSMSDDDRFALINESFKLSNMMIKTGNRLMNELEALKLIRN